MGHSLPSGALVLDAGVGVAPYRRHSSHTPYETADFMQVDKHYEAVDYVCDLAEIPVDDGRYDAVLLSQVLEHLPDPQRVLQSCFGCSNRTGSFWLSTPLFYAEHEQPYDYYRYTQYGLRHQLASVGFEVECLEWLEGYAGTAAYQLQEMVLRLPYWLERVWGRHARGCVRAPDGSVPSPVLSPVDTAREGGRPAPAH